MPISARENLLKTLRCEDPHWIPVCSYLFPNENPTQDVPAEVEDLIQFKSGDLAGDHLKLGAYLGADDYMIPVAEPACFKSRTCSFREEKAGTGRMMTILSTPKGELRQVTTSPEGSPSLVTERYVKTAEDAVKMTAYFDSLRVVSSPETQRHIRDIRQRVGDRGVLFCRTVGTPLGMCYRVYSDLTNLIYMMADEPGVVGDLFACMKGKYRELYTRMLEEAPEIDAYFGMDDTSTTLISPSMFEACNVALTNARADLCHRHGKLYLHHSCGLIRNLLPIYRKTRMDGVDAFTTPPIGDVFYAEGRKLLGPGYSLCTGLAVGLRAMDQASICKLVTDRFDDARKAGNVVFIVGGAHLTFPAMAGIFALAQSMKRG